MKTSARFAAALFVLFAAVNASAQKPFEPLGAPPEPKLPVRWNRYYDVKEIGDMVESFARAFPKLAKASVLGKSVGGLPIHALEITNFEKGDPGRKQGFYIDGNIHGNEIQATEVCLYTAWYLLENYGRVAKVTELLDERVFYILPSINPDGRDSYMHKPNSAHSSRGGIKPWDNDGDGTADEDAYDDLDGDGHIVEMRRRNPHGRWKTHPKDPRIMIPCGPEETGEWDMLDDEGLDNDGDGRINEDGPGGYDPNRNWPVDWQPPYVQHGANDFPFSLPETRAVGEFIMKHPNICGAQSYHNAGGMILRSPGREGAQVPGGDEALFQTIARKGESALPGYRSMIIWKDLYTVWGGEVDWLYFGRGILTYTNELWLEGNMFRRPANGAEDSALFNDLLLQGEAFVAWKAFKHPQYGDIEVGGMKKSFGRIPPTFLLEEECHRNMAFTLFHADQLPKVALDAPEIRPLGDGLFAVRATVRNSRLIPTRMAQDVAFKISRADEFQISGASVTPLSAGIVRDRDFNRVEPTIGRPATIRVDTVPGLGATVVEWVVKGSGALTVTFDSEKGGRVEIEAKLP